MRKRHYYQFTVFSLLVATSVVAVVCQAWIVVIQPYRHDEQVALEAARLGGRVVCEPRGPIWIRRLLGNDSCLRVVELDFKYGPRTANRPASSEITDHDMEAFRSLTELRRLHLDGSLITDHGLKHVSQLTKLEYLSFAETRITNEGLKHLEVLTGVTWLDLSGCEINDTGLARLAQMLDLEFLGLQETAVTNDGLRHLYGMKNLEHALMHQSYVTQTGIDKLADQLPRFDRYVIATKLRSSSSDEGR